MTKAKVTRLNTYEPRKEEVEEQVEGQVKKTGSHLTWEKPTAAELKRLNAAMVWKFLRLLLLSGLVSGYVYLLIWLRNLDLSLNAEVITVTCSSIPLLIYYMEFRAPLQFGERKALSDDIRDRAFFGYAFVLGNIVLAVIFLICVNFLGVIGYILPALMAILTYRYEYFMLLLYVCGKYTVKDGEVTFRRKYKSLEMSESTYKRHFWTSLVYLLDFEDAAERQIPVMVDYYTYCCFKKNGKAILINYQYGKSYMFEIIKFR